MKILLIGSGGREHALAWKLSQSPHCDQLYIAPGNPGTAAHGVNVSIPSTNRPALAAFAVQNQIDLAVIGAEAPLADGLADDLRIAGIAVFGPSRAAAQIEASKVFARHFMQRHDIPGPRYATFSNPQQALEFMEQLDYPVVVKYSGLAAGKGVILPDGPQDARRAVETIAQLARAGGSEDELETILVEERLEGEEVSLLAFTDGMTVRAMPPAQDHKRLLDGDRGPNTGGMGAYCPAPVCPPELAEQFIRTVLQPAVDGLRQEGRRFCGVLYAGLMLTASGPRVLEFNCRFGDPETQAILPLLKSDLLEICLACAHGKLHEMDVHWNPGASACVVLASPGYPERPVTGEEILLPIPSGESFIFHAGTSLEAGCLRAVGGRVLGVTAWAENLPQALERAYTLIEQIHFAGAHYRRDIGARALKRLQTAGPTHSGEYAYTQSGVDIDAGNRAVRLISSAVRSTYTPAVLAGIGSFGGLFDAAELQRMRQPVLVASTDGIGTKVRLARQAGRLGGLGHDIVNHCINDILVQGARPLFFLDYFAASKLVPEEMAEIVTGMTEACKAAGCALLGGETAEMPGVYAAGEFDVAGTIVGILERDCILPRNDLEAGDLLVGWRSVSPHTNGYSLIRRIFAEVPLDTVFPELGTSLAEALLLPHRSYLPLLGNLVSRPGGPLKALAHLTGGAFIENIPRILPEGLQAAVHWGSWPLPPLFRLIQSRAGISDHEMARVFNCGIGMVGVVSARDLPTLQAALPETTYVIGELRPGTRSTVLVP